MHSSGNSSGGLFYARSRISLTFRVIPKDFNSYGARRGNDAVMARGTFANIRLVNKFLSKPGPRTIHIPSGEEVSFDTRLSPFEMLKSF